MKEHSWRGTGRQNHAYGEEKFSPCALLSTLLPLNSSEMEETRVGEKFTEGFLEEVTLD